MTSSPPPTRDSLLGGALTLWQPARGHGYRFDLDPVLLAAFVAPAAHVLDLGAGCGVVGLLLLALGKATRVTAVELQPSLAALARENADANGVGDRVEVRCGDLRGLELPRVDAVVFNPPYFRATDGRAAPDPGRALGRTETAGTLADFIVAGARAVGEGGRVTGIVPARRVDEVAQAVTTQGLRLERRRDVCSRVGQAPRHVLWQARKDVVAAPAVVEPALVVHAAAGREFSPEVRALLRE